MIEEIIEVDSRQYKLNLEFPLSSEQKWQVADEIRRQQQLGVPIENMIVSLAPTCPVSPNNKRYVGQSVTLSTTPSGGNGTYTVVFKKDPGGSEVTLPTNGGPVTFNSSYTFQPTDVSTSAHIFRETVTDTCIGHAPKSEECSIYAIALNISITVNSSTNISLAAGASAPAIVMTCSDTLGSTICPAGMTYSSDNTTYISVNSSGIITAIASVPVGTTARITATATGYGGPDVISNQITVSICGPVSPNLVVS